MLKPVNTCPECFSHPWLREHVADESTYRGTCPSCGSPDQPLVPVESLYEAFHNLLSTYRPAKGPPFEDGMAIIYLIQEDWDVFSERLLESEAAGSLFEAIMHSGWDDDSGEPQVGAYDPYVAHHRRWGYDTLEDIWQEFAHEVKSDLTRPLEFRDAEFDEFLIQEELRGGRAIEVTPSTVLYRARPGCVRGPDGYKPWSGKDIGAPPAEKAGPGRANAKGNVVLYCADEEGTAVAEVRPARGEYVSVAPVHPVRELDILDLVSDPEWPNPFTDDNASYRVEFAELLMAFAMELSRPLRARDDPAEYIPSQKLAELIQKAGVDGIRYPSAMEPNGTNVVLFDPSVVRMGASRVVEIAKVGLEYKEVHAP
jgi:RES domain-containing protein